MRRDQATKHEARAETLRGAQHRFLVVLEIRIDLGLRDLPADFFRRVGLETEHAQAVVDRVEMGAVILLLRGNVAIRLAFADQDHDLAILDGRAAGRGQLLPDAVLLRLLLLAVRVVGLRELESLLLGR